MKQRILLVIFILARLISVVACTVPIRDMNAPAKFYYALDEVKYHNSEGMIKAEIRETALINADLKVLLNAYLAGPTSEEFRNPFPAGTQIIDATTEDDCIKILINDGLSSLSDIDLTVACACLSSTAMDYTGAASACILSENASLGSRESIRMTKEQLIFSDITATNYLESD